MIHKNKLSFRWRISRECYQRNIAHLLTTWHEWQPDYLCHPNSEVSLGMELALRLCVNACFAILIHFSRNSFVLSPFAIYLQKVMPAINSGSGGKEWRSTLRKRFLFCSTSVRFLLDIKIQKYRMATTKNSENDK